MVTACRINCEYYSTYTNTCDYTLLMYKSKGCPTNACTEYRPREARRSWNVFRNLSFPNCEGEEAMSLPTEESESRYVTADCGHEVYDGECMYEWEDMHTLCPECVEYKFNELSLEEKAALLDCEIIEINFPQSHV
jgi:hypothetical protein